LEQKHEAAIEGIEVLLNNSPNRIDLRLMKAQVYSSLKNYTAAASTFKEILELAPEETGSWLGLARTCLETEQWAESLNHSAQANRLTPKNKWGHYFQAYALAQLGSVDAAIQSAMEAIRLDPAFTEAAELGLELSKHSLTGSNKRSLFEQSIITSKAPQKYNYLQGRIRPRIKNESMDALKSKFSKLLTEVKARNHQHTGLYNQHQTCVVTGLPRSGTSLAMQLIQACGIDLLCDSNRAPDQFNQKGYWESDLVKRGHSYQSWFGNAQGKAVKNRRPALKPSPFSGECCFRLLCP
jgi:Cytochrome c biogenesis factor